MKIENEEIKWEKIFHDDSIVDEDFAMISENGRLTNGVSIVVETRGCNIVEVLLEYHELKKALDHLQADRDAGVVDFTDDEMDTKWRDISTKPNYADLSHCIIFYWSKEFGITQQYNSKCTHWIARNRPLPPNED